MANLDDDFVPFFSFFHFLPKWKGRKYFFRNKKKGLNRPFMTHANAGLKILDHLIIC